MIAGFMAEYLAQAPFFSSFFLFGASSSSTKRKKRYGEQCSVASSFYFGFFCAGLLPVAGVLQIRLGCPCMRRAGALYRPTGRRLLSGLQFIVTALILFEEELILSALLRNHFAFKHTSSVWPELQL